MMQNNPGKNFLGRVCTAAFFVFALAFTACPQPSDPAPKKPAAATPDQLRAKVNEANALFTHEGTTVQSSQDGSDITPDLYWVPTDIYEALQAAISEAETDIEWVEFHPGDSIGPNTMSNLVAAMAAFSGNINPGTFGEGKIRIRGTVTGAAWGTATVYKTSGDASSETSVLASKDINKTTDWDVWIDEELAGQTVYARFTVVKDETPTSHVSPEVSIPIPALESVPEGGLTGVTLEISGNVFDEGENIAPYALASSTSGGSSAPAAVDGNDSNPWSAGNAPVTLELDYFIPVSLNFVSLYHKGLFSPIGRILDFKIEYLDETDSQWKTAYAEINSSTIPGSSDGSIGYPFAFKSQTAQKFRLVVERARGSGNDTTNAVELFEIKTYRAADRDALIALIDQANLLLRDTAISYLNGDDIAIGSQWVGKAAYDNLNNTLLPIKVINNQLNTTAAEIASAVTDLGTAIGLFGAADGRKTPAPTADTTSAIKAEVTDTGIDFTLTGTYDGNAEWKVYNAAAGGVELAVSATYSSPTLTLSASPSALPAGDYFVSVTNPQKAESDRLHLTVNSPSTLTALPRVTNNIALSGANVEFTLTATYTETLTWKVYDSEGVSADITASRPSAGGPLVLSNGENAVPAGDYWITVTENTKLESERVKLTIVASFVSLVRASVDHNTPSIVRVEFLDEVTSITSAFFTVKVNDMPSVNMSGKSNPSGKPWLDFAIKENRAIVNAAEVADSSGKKWDLTMAAPAQYGEILRLAALANGGALAVDGAFLPAVSGLIIHNGIERLPYDCEDSPGFYQIDPQGNTTPLLVVGDGTDGTIPGDEVFKRAMLRLEAGGTKAQNGYTYVIVLGEDQQASASSNYFLTADFTYTGAEKTTILIVSDSDTDERKIPKQSSGYMLLTVRDGINLILGRKAVIDLDNAVTTEGPVMLDHGGKFILDGGSIRNHKSDYGRGGGVHSTSLGSAAYGAYVIIRDGTITGNASGGAGAAGGISIGVHGTVLMQGGEISGNSSPSGAKPKAGGISMNSNNNNGAAFTNDMHGSYSFFMTGGEIKDNANAANGAGGGGAYHGNVPENRRPYQGGNRYRFRHFKSRSGRGAERLD